MKSRSLLTFLLLAATALPGFGQDLKKDFENPSQSARPRVWWHWMNGNITADGIYKDLHWMHDAGIVGFHNFDAGLETPQIVEKRIAYMTPEWDRMFSYALDVADSLGMEVTIASSPGWSVTGGPWVSPDDAMKKLVWRTLEIEGGSASKGGIRLPEGFSCCGNFQDDALLKWDTDRAVDYYRDIAVLAVKLLPEDLDLASLSPELSASTRVEGLSFASLNSDSVSSGVKVSTDANGLAWVQYAFDKPLTVKSVVVSERKIAGDANAVVRELQCSDDGVNFRKVATLPYQSTIQKTYSVPATTARYFRLVLKDSQKLAGGAFDLRQFMLSTMPGIQDAGDKAGFGFYRLLYLEDTYPDGNATPLENVLDLTEHFKDGVLDYSLPQGRWRIYRFGCSLTGKRNHPASPEATGLEVDKLDKAAVRRYLETYLGTYDRASGGRLGPAGIRYMLTDSYEAGPQTWTGNLIEEFRSRKGYDLVKWLPAIAGTVLGSTAQTERFLFDWKTCLGELMAQNHYDVQNEVLGEYGMKRYTESHENYRALLADGMDCKHLADVPMSAFWMSYKQGITFTPRFEADIRESASVAHIYGQNIAAAESFTSNGPRHGAWVFSPAVLRPTADAAMAAGLNRFIIHCSPHQPVDDKKPGLGLGIYGQWFNRHQTWANQARAWTDYLSRSCELLQKGRFVADVAIYYGEDNNITGIYLNDYPQMPQGYNYDYFNRTVLMDVAKPENGIITIPEGMSYRALSLGPNVRHMSMKVLRRIREYADAGVPVCGCVPETLAGLEGTQEEFDALVKDIWYSGRPNVKAGADAGVFLGHDEDFRADDMSELGFVHRTLADGEIYWVLNRSKSARSLVASFRTSGRRPEIWHAEDGSAEACSYRMLEGRTEVSLELQPQQSVFVVFGERSQQTEYSVPERQTRQLGEIGGPWKVAFQKGMGAPESIVLEELSSLSENADPGVRYFSGEATYSNSFRLSGKDIRTNDSLVLDLGDVGGLAEVTVNGQNLGVLWCHPFRIDITGAVRKGVNTIEVKAVNTWHNRVLGDMQPGVEKKISYYPVDLLKADDPLLPSGLLGPVRVLGIH
ncbi:MAG: discoidin domain-containing protein [Bacteroidales bacterium]|nr:discoidin domain-containing protein [Candidatus Cryptobacteroides equifaecalis]